MLNIELVKVMRVAQCEDQSEIGAIARITDLPAHNACHVWQKLRLLQQLFAFGIAYGDVIEGDAGHVPWRLAVRQRHARQVINKGPAITAGPF